MSRQRKKKSKSSFVLAPIEPSPSHGVTDIINSVFNKKEAVELSNEDSSTALVSPEDSLLHDHKDTKYSNLCQKKFDEYSQLEREIQQAIATWLKEQETQLRLAQEKFPSYHDSRILQEPCPISQYLNENKLRSHGLLIPSDFRPVEAPPQRPPEMEYPNYISNTFTFDQHSRVLPNPATKISLKSQPAWKFTMSAEEREIAKKSLRELNRKTNYLHNPRHSAHAHINTASYGPTKNNTRDKSKKIKSIFIAEPSQVTFTDYIAGETYKVHFK
jgi:hypothetical protein